MVLRKNGTQEKDVEMPLNGMWRMIQDSSAAFIFLVPNGRRDGLIVYGPSADGLELGVPREFDLKGNRVDYHIFLAMPRAGVPVADVVDGAFCSTDAKWVYFRIQLR